MLNLIQRIFLRDGIERAINKLDELNYLEHTADKRQVLNVVEENDKLLHDEKCQIAKNVPYRLLSSFMKELGGNDPLWDQRKKLVAYIKIINESRCIDVGMIISQLEIYDQIWFVRHAPKKGEHSREAIELVTEIIARLEGIPDGCAECFPFELIDEFKQEYLTDNS